MFSKGIARYLHLHSTCWAAEKSQLAVLRKKTGYTFSNCKKALEVNSNDLVQAEKWLNQQAQALGWSKAIKLEGRTTTQGLVAVAIENNDAALVEVNCETDFVAKNNVFQEMAERVARACLTYAHNQPEKENPITEISLTSEDLCQLPSDDNKSLADQMALMIGSLGENATLRRAICVKASKDIYLSKYAHPIGTENNNVLLGRLAGIVALKQKEVRDIDIEQLGKDLCQHVVGMAPKRIGSPSDEPSKLPEEEICLIHQEYLVDSSATVNEILEENAIEVVDFKRFECGERLSTIIEQPLSMVETCQ